MLRKIYSVGLVLLLGLVGVFSSSAVASSSTFVVTVATLDTEGLSIARSILGTVSSVHCSHVLPAVVGRRERCALVGAQLATRQ
jgi:hypothetical protein